MLLTYNADGSRLGREDGCSAAFMYSSLFLLPRDVSKTEAATITKLDTDMDGPPRVMETHYFGVKR